MPVDHNLPTEGMIYQRNQYAKGGIGRLYWDYKDEQVISFVGDSSRIIDIGCGEGILLEKLVKRFPDRQVIGVDLSKENIEICKRHNLPVVYDNIFDLKFADNSFDCCIFMEVIEHLTKPEKAILEIHRILKNDGKLILIFPNDVFFKMARILTLKFKEAYYECGHVKQWKPREMKRFLAGYGFDVIKQKNLPFLFWNISLHHMIAAKCKK